MNVYLFMFCFLFSLKYPPGSIVSISRKTLWYVKLGSIISAQSNYQQNERWTNYDLSQTMVLPFVYVSIMQFGNSGAKCHFGRRLIGAVLINLPQNFASSWRRSTISRLPARRASGFSGDHQKNHQCLWFSSYYIASHVGCPMLFVFCWE